MTQVAFVKPDNRLQEAKPCSFIYEYRGALSMKDCDKMIKMFEEHAEEQTQGRVGWGAYQPNLKKSTDLYLRGQEHWAWADKLLHDSLVEAVQMLSEHYPIFQEDRLEDYGYQLQRTEPGQYYHWHKDLNQHSRKRVLVAIWYLNTMPESAGGETEFLRQDVKIRPESGKLLLFPPYWTHVHRGCEVREGVKYVATTWVCYSGANDDDGHDLEKLAADEQARLAAGEGDE